MLTRFAVKNYRGFEKKIVWDLSHPSGYDFNTFAICNGVIKNGIIYGPNGSGKSNLAWAIFDIILHLTQKNKHLHQIDTIINVNHPQDLVDFEYEFTFGQTHVEYNYSKNSEGLRKESIRVDDRLLFALENNILTVDDSVFPMTDETKQKLANSSNKVSILNFLWNVYPMSEDHPLMQIKSFVERMLLFWSLEDRGYAGFDEGTTAIEEYIIDNGLVGDFEEFLKAVSSQDYHFKSPNEGDKLLMCDMGDGIAFNKIRSTGTSSLTLLYFWMHKMSKASFVIIDEFDAFYHYDLSFQVCKKLFGLSNQIFLTSHNTFLMQNDLLRPDCNFLINHNHIKPLCDCTEKELRWGNNIEKMYRGNAFGV